MGQDDLTRERAQRECCRASERKAVQRADRVGVSSTANGLVISVTAAELQETWVTENGWSTDGTATITLNSRLLYQTPTVVDLSSEAVRQGRHIDPAMLGEQSNRSGFASRSPAPAHAGSGSNEAVRSPRQSGTTGSVFASIDFEVGGGGPSCLPSTPVKRSRPQPHLPAFVPIVKVTWQAGPPSAPSRRVDGRQDGRISIWRRSWAPLRAA